MTVRIPNLSTLAKYGFGEGEWALADDALEDWSLLLEEQRGGCGVCGRVPPAPRNSDIPYLVVDHDHVRGWKIFPAEVRRMHVRGLCCTRCNHFVLTRYATAELHIQAAAYLERHATRLGDRP